MNAEFNRRDFVRMAAALPVAFAVPMASGAGKPPAGGAAWPLETFDYRGVRLLPSRWLDQYWQTREYDYEVSNDDILHGYRVAAGLPAPGKTLGGWCAKNSDVIFGQWLSGFARMYCATGDREIRDKAVFLLEEWGKTLGPGGDCRMNLYAYDKMLCALVDLQLYAGVREAAPLLESTMAWVMRTYSRERTPANPRLQSGRPGEWYT
ncbi:MAG TPA: beta-L-arabinofuranosidase domain-containing protein, partial [Acidimicrobiales bacterium]|nr:beta-L-arabinofuranosidase domain-containing protein [Acidimicrobiales bacterium]